LSAAARPAERRRADRRRGAAATAKPRPLESWFGALGVAPDTQLRDAAWPEDEESRFEAGSQAAQRPHEDSRFLSREARRIVGSGTTAFQRIYGAFLGARAALGAALFLAQLAAYALGLRPPADVSLVCAAYALQAVLWWSVPHLRRATPAQALSKLRSTQWLATIGVDLVCFTALHLIAPASGLNYVALLVLPVLMAGVLTPRRFALATAAAVSLMLLASGWIGVMAGADPALALTQAGLAGSGFFVITLLAGELAGRLAREELAARGGLELARQQAQLNRLVIEEMQEGVLVVDRKGRVRTANPAARVLLAPSGSALAAPFALRGVEAWEPLVRAVERGFREAAWPVAGREATLQFAPGLARTLLLRMRFTRRREPHATEELCVLFIEDVRAVQARTRQEKLAAMGRVSAGIAHEIRNPLAAIAQANALMAEDATTAGQRQLTQLVTDNVERLKRIIEDVMEVAPGATPVLGSIDATAQIGAICAEWARTAHLPRGEASALRIGLPEEPLGVVFDVEHLRRVLVNLLDNALRHGGGGPASIAVQLQAFDETTAVLSVASAGDPIAPDVERFLFEPFFSTRSRGTGLGLYICRELCERYGASIEYRARPSGVLHNEFVAVLRRDADLALGASASRSLFTS
jgi:two-component system sensor histidine kinase PilS (NtrC family)